MAQRYVISRFAFVSWRDGNAEITSPVAGKTVTLADPSLLGVLAAFAIPRTLDDFPQEVREWIDAAILVDAGAPELAAVNHWDIASLALHAASRDESWRKTPGHATPAVAPRRSDDAIPLMRGGSDLFPLLDARRSRREWAAAPMTFRAFSDLLWLSARNREPSPFKKSVSRPYPSGGAAYSLEIYPVLGHDAVETLNAGVYRYLPDAHALELVSPFDADWQPFLWSAGNAMRTTPPPVALIITSRFARQSEEYGSLAYSLILKEVGCLYQTLYLVAGSLGLAACALGGGNARGLLDVSDLEEPVVGEFAVGRTG